jgi:hypothetical protein
MREITYDIGTKRMLIKPQAASACNDSCWGHELWVTKITTDYSGKPNWCQGYVQDIKCKGVCSFKYGELVEIGPGRRELI